MTRVDRACRRSDTMQAQQRQQASSDSALPDPHVGINTLFLIPGAVGGTETYLLETVRALLPQFHGKITFFTNRENDAFLRRQFGEHLAVAFDNLDFDATRRVTRILREQWQLPRHLRRAGCDVLWSPGYTACLMAPCPQAVTIHDMQYRRYPSDLSFLGWWATHLLVSLAARRCDRLLAVSRFTRDEIAHFTSASPDRIVVTPEAVSTRFLEQAARPDRNSASVQNARPYLLCVASSYPHKNLETLVRAFDLLAQTLPHDLVLVGGRGRGEKSLQAAIASAVHRDRIHRRQGLELPALIELYRGADLFVLPSLYEGFGLPLLEAMAVGVPVLTTLRGAIPEVCGQAARFCDPLTPEGLAQAMREELNMPPEARTRRIEQGRHHAAGFRWDRTAALTRNCLRAIARDVSESR